MRRFGVVVVAVAALFGVAAVASADDARTPPPAGRQTLSIEVDGHTIPVVVLVPAGDAPEHGFPLVVSLHGQSVDGTRECDHNWRPQAGVVIACPTEPSAPWRGGYGEKIVLETARALLTRWTLDPEAVFLSGASTGGIGAWRFAVRRADRFAGVVPRAGMPPMWTDPVLSNLLGLGVYIVHGASDTTIRPEADQRAAERLHELGGDVTYRELDGGHSAFPDESAAIATWIGRHRRNPAPARFTYALSRNLGDLPDRVHWLGFGGRSGSPFSIEARADRATGAIDVTVHEGFVEHLTILLDDRLVAPDCPVVVRVGGVERYRGTPARDPALRQRLVEETGDPGVGFDRSITVDLPVPETAARPQPAARRDRRHHPPRRRPRPRVHRRRR